MSCSVTPAMAREKEMEQVDRILDAKEDDYGGVNVEMTNEPLDPSVFGSLLRASLSHWRQQVFLILCIFFFLVIYFYDGAVRANSYALRGLGEKKSFASTRI